MKKRNTNLFSRNIKFYDGRKFELLVTVLQCARLYFKQSARTVFVQSFLSSLQVFCVVPYCHLVMDNAAEGLGRGLSQL